jgi:hypothetical protein
MVAVSVKIMLIAAENARLVALDLERVEMLVKAGRNHDALAVLYGAMERHRTLVRGVLTDALALAEIVRPKLLPPDTMVCAHGDITCEGHGQGHEYQCEKCSDDDRDGAMMRARLSCDGSADAALDAYMEGQDR